MPYADRTRAKSKNLNIRMTPKEMERLKQLASKRQTSISEAIRELILDAWLNEVARTTA